MRRFTDRMAVRILASHVLVLVVGATVTALISRTLAGSYFDGHLAEMAADAAGGMSGEMLERLSSEFDRAFLKAFALSAAIGGAVAFIAGTVASIRLLRPIDLVRRATRRMASGRYAERTPVPVETELAALAQDVNALGAALEEVEERRVRLIGEVVHELRTPLTTIQGYMEALLDGVLESNNEIFAATAREASRLQRVAADLSLLSKSEENRLDLTMELVDLGEVAAGVVAQLGPQFEAHGVAIAIERTGPLPVTGDADRLAQVFTNIVGNALEHTPEGGSVRIEARRHGDTAEVRVADTGRGIPPEMIDLVFERFFRADRTRPGTGIGLTIARRIVRLHGGFMTAESEGPGRGATFTVSIPLGGHPVSGPA